MRPRRSRSGWSTASHPQPGHTRARARRRASATRACWPPSSSRPAGERDHHRRRRGDGRGARERARRSSGPTNVEFRGAWRPSGSTCRRRRVDARAVPLGLHAAGRPRGGAARDAPRARPAGASRSRCGTRLERNPWLRRRAPRAGRAAGSGSRRPRRARPVPPVGRPAPSRSCWRTRASPRSQVEAIDLEQRAASLDDWWEHLQDTSGGRSAQRGVRLSPAEHYRLRDAFDAGYEEYVRDDGSLAIPARALVAAASA